MSAIKDVESANINAKVQQVELDDYLIASEMTKINVPIEIPERNVVNK